MKMKLSREIDYNGTTLQVHGKYESGSPSVEGSIEIPPVFEISEIVDISLPKSIKIVTDLYEDFFEELEQIIILVISKEDPEDYYTEDYSQDATLDLASMEEIFLSMANENTPFEVNDSSTVPVKFDGVDGNFHNHLTISKLLTDLVLELSEPEDQIIACKISHDGIKFTKLSDI